jgi:hypothetical protein
MRKTSRSWKRWLEYCRAFRNLKADLMLDQASDRTLRAYIFTVEKFIEYEGLGLCPVIFDINVSQGV